MIISGSKKASAFEKGFISELSQLIDGNMLDFEKHLEKADYGYVKSLDVLLENTYLSLQKVKDAYLVKIDLPETDEETREKLIKALDKVYAEMMKIEHKSLFLNDWLKKHALSIK